MKPEKPHGTQPKHANGTPIPNAPPQTEPRFMNLNQEESYLLQNGMLNLEADFVSAILQTDDVLMLSLKIEGRRNDLPERLICLKRLLEKSHRLVKGLSLLPLKG